MRGLKIQQSITLGGRGCWHELAAQPARNAWAHATHAHTRTQGFGWTFALPWLPTRRTSACDTARVASGTSSRSHLGLGEHGLDGCVGLLCPLVTMVFSPPSMPCRDCSVHDCTCDCMVPTQKPHNNWKRKVRPHVLFFVGMVFIHAIQRLSRTSMMAMAIHGAGITPWGLFYVRV